MEYKEHAKRILKVHRALHDLSQSEMAVKCGISVRSVAKIEKEESVSDVTMNMALKVAGYELEVNKKINPIGNEEK